MVKTWNELSSILEKQALERRIPLNGQFELTNRCNLQCKMCYICTPPNDKASLSGERTAEEWIHLAKEARDAGMLYILLTGGEVFLRRDFSRIYEEISQMGLVITIYTNATLITREIAGFLGRIPPSMVEVTLYGASPETYERVCGHAEGYENAIRGIDLLLAEGIKLRLRTTIIRNNVQDFDDMALIAEKRGLPFGIVDYVIPRREGNYINPDAERLSPRELSEFQSYFESYCKNKLGYVERIQENVYTDNRQYDINNPFFCGAGRSDFWVTWNGRMTPCGVVDTPAVLPFETGFGSAWKELQEICTTVPVCNECINCSLKDYCLTCPARLKCETHSYSEPAQYLCKLALETKNRLE